jgi:hypothetical protein
LGSSAKAVPIGLSGIRMWRDISLGTGPKAKRALTKMFNQSV